MADAKATSNKASIETEVTDLLDFQAKYPKFMTPERVIELLAHKCYLPQAYDAELARKKDKVPGAVALERLKRAIQ